MTAPGFPPLREVQRLVWRLLTAPEGVAQGEAALRAEGVLASGDLALLVRSDERLAARERLDVYADMYFYRLRDCLAEDFPAVKAVLGGARFHNLVTDYLLAHPSTHFSLRELGRALPGFLASHPLSQDFEAIADLARLEWARLDVFDETDVSALSRERLLARASAAPEAFAFGPAPATRLIRVAASALPVWKRVEDGGSPGRDACRLRGDEGPVLVWRRGRSILHRALADDEALCLEAARAAPVGVARLGALLVEAEPDAAPERISQRLAGLLERWCRDAILVEA